MRDPVRITTASALVPACPAQVWDAVTDLSDRLWTARCVAEDPHRELVLAVGDDADCWLTWTLHPAATGATRVEVVCSEQADDAPPPELDELLLALVLRYCSTPA